MDWLASGIRNRFEYELVDVFNLDEHRGWLDCVTGGKITEDIDAECFSSASLDVDGAELDPYSMVRVWHVAESDDETCRRELGTFMLDSGDLSVSSRRMYGSVSLLSPLAKLNGDLRRGDRGVGAGTGIVEHFESIVSASGGTPWVHPQASAAGFPDSHVWEAGESVLKECSRCAQALGMKLGVDAHGRVTLDLSQTARKREATFDLTLGEATCLSSEISVESPDICNRVVASYERDDVRYFASAEVDASHPWHRNRIGRWAVEELSTSSIEEGDDVQSVLDRLVRERLSEASDTRRTFTGSMPYRPISVGETGYLPIVTDSGTDRAFVQLTQREMTLDAAMETSITLKELVR